MLINLLNLCRIRRKFPLPRTIWDGEETSYCFKEKSRQVSCCCCWRGLSRVLFWLVVNWDPSCVQPRHASYAMFGNLWQCTVLEEGTINFFVLSRKKFSARPYQTKYASEPIIASFMLLIYSCCCCLLIRAQRFTGNRNQMSYSHWAILKLL